MGCSPCAAAARRRALAAGNGIVTKYVWQSADGLTEKEYDTPIEAKAKVARMGGTVTPRDLPVQ